MRHRMRSAKLGRTSAHRKALYRNLVTSLLEHGRIQTTDTKAKQVRRLADRMITLGKRGTLQARRRALRVIRNREVTARVFDDLAERFRDRPGGYTRVLKLGPRAGDAAPVSLVELVGDAGAAPPTARKAAAKEKAGKPAKAARAPRAEKAKPAAKPRKPAKPAPAKSAAKKKPASRKKSGARKRSD